MQTPEPTPPSTPPVDPGAPHGPVPTQRTPPSYPFQPAVRPTAVPGYAQSAPPPYGFRPAGAPGGYPSRPGYPPPGFVPGAPRKRHRGVLSVAYTLAILVLLTYVVAGSPLARLGESLIGRAPAASGPDNAVGATFNGIMRAQARALTRGDRDGYLAYVDHAMSGAVDSFGRMFDNLRQMHVTSWRAEAESGDVAIGDDKTYTASVAYCLATSPCTEPLYVSLQIEAAVVGAHALLERLMPPMPSPTDHDPRPWLTTHLTAAVGDRVIVAAPPQYAGQVKSVLAIAQAAARADDELARWGKPSIYILYLAGTEEANQWFDARLENVAGYAANVSDTDIEAVAIVPYADDIGEGGLTALIRHEFAHVATLQNDNNDGTDSFIEGIAEYAAYRDHPTWAKWRFPDIRKFARGKWNGQVLLTDEMSSDVPGVTSAAYGIGYLALKRIVDRYGLDKMLDFWGSLEQKGMSVQDSSIAVFGVKWSAVNADCAAYVRTAVGA